MTTLEDKFRKGALIIEMLNLFQAGSREPLHFFQVVFVVLYVQTKHNG